MAEVNCRAFGREDALVRRPAVRVSQVADAGTALGGGNFDPIAPRQRIDQVKTDFHTEAGREVVVIRRKPRQERAQLTNLGLMEAKKQIWGVGENMGTEESKKIWEENAQFWDNAMGDECVVLMLYSFLVGRR